MSGQGARCPPELTSRPQVRFKPCKVFVVFNDETSQRLCLEKMTKGALQRHLERPTMRNRLVGAYGRVDRPIPPAMDYGPPCASSALTLDSTQCSDGA